MQRYSPHKGFTLMPAVALATLAAVVAVPALSASHLYAAGPDRSASVTVRSGDTLWAIAERTTPAGGNIIDTVDTIVATNRLSAGGIIPGQRLRVPAR